MTLWPPESKGVERSNICGSHDDPPDSDTRMSHQEEFDTRTSIDIQGTVPSVLGNLDDFIWGIALGKGGC